MLSVQLMLALLHGSAAAADASPAPVSAPASNRAVAVIAVADDVHSVVLRDADGHLQRYGVGAHVAPLWRVAGVAQGEVVLRYTRTFAGNTLDMRLHAGESVDLEAQAAALEKAAQPIAVPKPYLSGAKPAPAKSQHVPAPQPSH